MATTEPLHSQAELLRLDTDTGSLRARRYRVTVVSGPDDGKEVELVGTVIVGSGPNSVLQLSDGTVSRHHLELTARGDGVRVRDLGSTNGTTIAGARIGEAFIERETTLKVGKTVLKISLEEHAVGNAPGPDRFGEALGQSDVMRRLFGLLQRVAPTDSSVLLQGETGTGKEVLARALHDASRRAQGPFVIFDCGAVAPSLIESELFGHVKGAFTGAISDRKGAFMQADGGTLFLDEIGELPLELQPKLLRALEAGTVKRVGEDRPRSVDVRIIAATHRKLEARISEGLFRQDLYFRLAVVPLVVPSLRERKGDLPLLASHFLKQIGAADMPLSEELLERLAAYDWPGNLRELRNVVARAVVGAGSELPMGAPPAGPKSAAPSHPPPQAGPGTDGALGPEDADLDVPFKELKERLVERFTRDYLIALLDKHDGNITQASKAAGLARAYVHRLVVKYGLKASDS